MPKWDQEKLYPNFFKELRELEAEERDSALVDSYIGSVLSRLQILHSHEGSKTNEDFFNHLSQYAEEQARQIVKRDNKGEGYEVDVDLYIGGGVVRTMLANMYKAVHEQKSAAKVSTEQALKTATESKEKLLSPFVLGVGSDLDIYIETRFGGAEGPSLPEQIAYQEQVGREVSSRLEQYINKLETDTGLYQDKNPMKHSLLPVADVKEYHYQVRRVLEQGGSMLDTLAYKINPKHNERCLRHPAERLGAVDNWRAIYPLRAAA